MKSIIFVLISLAVLTVQGADENYAPINPQSSLKENECVFDNKNKANYMGYPYIIKICDSRLERDLFLKYGSLVSGSCAYDVLKRWTGKIEYRVMMKCPEQNQEQAIIPQDNIADEEIMAMPPAPEEKPVQKPIVKKKTSAKPVVPNENTDKDNEVTPEIKNYIPPAVDQDF